MPKNILKNILILTISQFIILTVNLMLNKAFLNVILITYIFSIIFRIKAMWYLFAQIITIIFVLVFENEEGVYLLYYLHSGQSQWFNPDIFTDALIVAVEMLFVQLVSAILAKCTSMLYNRFKGRCKRNITGNTAELPQEENAVSKSGNNKE